MRLRLKRRPQRKREAKRKIIILPVLILAAAGVVAFCFFDMKTSTMLREVAQSEFESIAFDIIGRTLEEELQREDISYDNIVKIERDERGKVSAVTADMQKLNLLKLRIANKLSEEMFIRTEDTIKIPLGNLTGIDFLTGVGPDVKFRTMWVSSVNGEFSNSFESAGINQTRHRIMLNFTINVGMMFAGREIGTDVDLDVCVAETVIVGDIPDFFVRK